MYAFTFFSLFHKLKMRTVPILLIIFFASILHADIMLYDGETPATDAWGGNQGPTPYPQDGAHYEHWWNVGPEDWPPDNDLVDTNYNPYEGAKCGKWYSWENPFPGGGVYIFDEVWAGLNFDSLIEFELYARGTSGGETFSLNFGTPLVPPDTGLSAKMVVSGLTTSWKKYTFARSQIETGSQTNFTLEKVTYLQFWEAGPGASIVVYIDNMKIITGGFPEEIIMNGDSHPLTNRGAMPHCTTSNTCLQQFLGDACGKTTI